MQKSNAHGVSDETKRLAHLLYLELHDRRPSLDPRNPCVGAKVFEDPKTGQKHLEPFNAEFFSDRLRVNYLLDWTLKIVPVWDLLLGKGKLPISREVDIEEFLHDVIGNFLEEVRGFTDNQIMQANDITALEHVYSSISLVIRKYLSGEPSEAYRYLEEIMKVLTQVNGHEMEALFSTMGERPRDLYKMRTGTNHIYSVDEMFHIPFEKRGLVSTQRYSIPGLPCLYLGSSPLTCWEEVGKPDLNTVQTSLFLAREELSFLDFSMPPVAVCEHVKFMFQMTYGKSSLEGLYKDLRTYINLWPLIAACSIRVQNPKHAFKPEYIIPQLLLQWVRRSANYDGVCYFSTKISDYSLQNYSLYRNYAFPVKDCKPEGQCEQLRSKFDAITRPAPWQMFQLYKDQKPTKHPESKVNAEIEMVKGVPILYRFTDFCRLESFLISSL